MTLTELAAAVGERLLEQGQMLVTAESCTGGWVSQVITDLPGSSRWFDRGFVTYSNAAKRDMLGVSTEILARFGAVSEQTARTMSEGALAHSRAQFALSITGIAGPGGGRPEKPVGTVCFGWAGKDRITHTETRHFSGDREQVRRQSVENALQGLLTFMTDTPGRS